MAAFGIARHVYKVRVDMHAVQDFRGRKELLVDRSFGAR